MVIHTLPGANDRMLHAAKQPDEASTGMVGAIVAGARALPPALRSSCAALEAFCRSVLPAPSSPQPLCSACAALYPLLPRALGQLLDNQKLIYKM